MLFFRNSSKNVWKIGTPFFKKDKRSRCYHTQIKPINSWDVIISWKNFNQRYADLINECNYCRSTRICVPACDCKEKNCKIDCCRSVGQHNECVMKIIIHFLKY